MKKLEGLEKQIMGIIWDENGPITVRSIMWRYNEPPHLNTVCGTLLKLEKEGFISHVGYIHDYFNDSIKYYALVSQNDYNAFHEEKRAMIRNLFKSL